MTPLFAAALEVQEFIVDRGWSFCIIGGLALLRWGEPRFTRDIDITLLAGFGQEDAFIRPLLAAFRARLPDAMSFAIRNRVLLIEASNGVPIDIALGGLPFEALAVERSSLFEFEPGCALRTCSAEDLLVHKLFAFRPRDIIDAEGIAARMGGRLEWDYVETQLLPLAAAKEEDAIVEELRRLRRRYSAPTD